MAPRKPLLGISFKVGVPAVATALLLFAGSMTSAGSVSADVCTDTAIAFGANDGEVDDDCVGAGIFANQAATENFSSPFSFGFAFATVETAAGATIDSPTYAWAFNTNTILGAALSSNDIYISGVVGFVPATPGPGGSAYAIASNLDSLLVLATAENDVVVSNVNIATPVFERNVHANATNTSCFLCLASSTNNVEINGVYSDNAGVSRGSIYSNAVNEDAIASTAVASNSIFIGDVNVLGYVLTGDDDEPSHNGSYAIALNTGGLSSPCVDCHAAAYNTVNLDAINIPGPSAGGSIGYLEAARSVATNNYSSGSDALAFNNLRINNFDSGFESGLVGDRDLAQVNATASNDWSEDSKALAFNDVDIIGSDGSGVLGKVAAGSIYATGSNYYCETCLAAANNDIYIHISDVPG